MPARDPELSGAGRAGVAALQDDDVSRGWRDALTDLRDRMLSDPGFRRFATALPFTRFVARRRARQLFDVCAGFVYSQVLLACVRINLFEILRDGPATPEALASRLSFPLESMSCLLDAATALGLAERRRGGRYGLGKLGAALLSTPGLESMIEHHALLYRDLTDPVALLRREIASTGLSRYWPYADAETRVAGDANAAARYSALMSATVPMVADEILEAYPFDRHRCLLDVGGGQGTFLRSVAARNPGLGLMLFDLPAVVARARDEWAAAGLENRLNAVEGDFFADPLPTGADVVTLVRIVHDHDDASVRRLLAAVHSALPRGGTLLIAEPMAGTRGAEAMGDAYFGLYLLAMGRGRPRTSARLTGLLQEAGFGDVRVIPTRIPLVTGAIVARAN